MARWLVFVVLASGCRQLWGLSATPGLESDAAIDAPVDIASELPPNCYGSFGSMPYCLGSAPVNDFKITALTTIDTGDAQACTKVIADQCVIAARSIEIDARFAPTGSRPLVMIATTSIVISALGMLDVASHAGTTGPGSNAADCGAPMGPGMGGGGAGGSFAARGGNGGNGELGNGGGAAVASAPPRDLRGGCAGGIGEINGGAPGDGGGAVYLIANDMRIDGQLDASGAGGGGAKTNPRGGGGGGSGGMIVLEAAVFEIASGVIFANGGGGGGASGNNNAGIDGSDPAGVMAAPGGNGANAGDGGAGSSGADGTNGQSSALTAGGGGGGGAGVIKTFGGAITDRTALSPPPS
jgi:hypothetical protein